jgi:hypothetical protein
MGVILDTGTLVTAERRGQRRFARKQDRVMIEIREAHKGVSMGLRPTNGDENVVKIWKWDRRSVFVVCYPGPSARITS